MRVSLLTAWLIRRKRAAHSTVAGQFGRRAKSLFVRTVCHWHAARSSIEQRDEIGIRIRQADANSLWSMEK